MADTAWTAIFASDTFWGQTVPLAFGAMLCAGLFALLAWRVASRGHLKITSRLRGLHRDESGAASVFDFALTIPIFITVLFLLTQLALMANASLVIHYSAYSAARTAKAQMLDMDHAFWELDCCGVDTLIAPVVGGLALANLLFEPDSPLREELDDKVHTAAAFQLISLAPAKRTLAADRETPPFFDKIGMEEYLTNLVDGDVRRAEYLLYKARYAFDKKYTRVKYGSSSAEIVKRVMMSGTAPTAEDYGELYEEALVAWELAGRMTEPTHALATITSVPVYARVEFRFPLLVPFASAIFNQSDIEVPGDQKGIWLSARVDLS